MSRLLMKMAERVTEEFLGCHVQMRDSTGARHGKLVEIEHVKYEHRPYRFTLERVNGSQYVIAARPDSEVSIVVNDGA